MARNTRRTTHPYQHVREDGKRGVAGYKAVAADAKNDPAVIYPPRQAVVPADGVTPIYAGQIGAEEIAGGGGAAEPGTLVADPPELAPDLVAALGAANAPGGSNAVATLEDIPLKRATVTLIDAQIKALPTTPVELIPAPGAGSTIVPLMLLAQAVGWEGNGYTNLDVTTCLLYTLLESGIPLTTYDENMFGTFGTPGPDDVYLFTPYANVAGALLAAAVMSGMTDAALMLWADNGASGNWTGGDPANTMKVTVIYTVLVS